MLATVDGDPLAPAAIGTPVCVGWRQGPDDRVVPVFTAVQNGLDQDVT